MQHLYIDGGKTIQKFLKAQLIDEITITQTPILLGSGIPLFDSIGIEIPLTHLETTSTDNGFVQTKYRVR
jgi:dihydrofolate reductase